MTEADKTAFRIRIKTLAFSWQAKKIDRDTYRGELDKVIEEIYSLGRSSGERSAHLNKGDKPR